MELQQHYLDSPERLAPRLGQFLVKNNLIEPMDLEFALREQQKMSCGDEQPLLGNVMIELGLIDRQTLDRAITEQIYQLQEALKHTNQALERRVQKRTQELESALTRLSELNQLKANFISNVSHELRMPLQFVVGYLDLLSTGTFGPLTEDQNKAVDSLVKASQDLRKLVEQITEFSDLSRDKMPLQMAPISLEEQVHTAISQLLPQAKSREVELRAELAPDLPLVDADGRRINWVISQLLENGIKFTPSGGMVKIQTTSRDKEATVTVTDTGIGIPQNKMSEIFQLFHQLDGSMTRRHGGTGLGLALVQSILQAHGTSIQVRSQPGAGSRFAFSLPFSNGILMPRAH